MVLFDCPQGGRKVDVHANACQFCSRSLSDPLTQLKAQRACIDAQWEKERREFARDFSAWERFRRKGALAAGAVSILAALLLVAPLWLAIRGHVAVDAETVLLGLCVLLVFGAVRLGAGAYLGRRASLAATAGRT